MITTNATQHVAIRSRKFNPYLPAQIPGLGMWLDASEPSSITVATGTSEWRDKSGNGRSVSQAGSGNQPWYNGRAVVFDGIDDFLTNSYNLSSTPESSLFAVVRYRSVSASLGITMGFGSNSSFAGQTLERGRTSGKLSWTVGRNSPSGAEKNKSGRDIVTVPVVQGNVYSGATTLCLVNNTVDATDTFTGPLNSGSGFTVGRYFTTGFPVDADIHEIVHYNRALTDEERVLLHTYFFAKWGIQP